MRSRNSDSSNRGGGGGCNGGNGGRNGGSNITCRQIHKTPEDANFKRRITNKYCWTYEGCAHTSTECTLQIDRHKKEATLVSRMGGSNVLCE